MGGRRTGLPPAPPTAQGAGDARLRARRGGQGPESWDARPQRSLPAANGDSAGSTLLWDHASQAVFLPDLIKSNLGLHLWSHHWSPGSYPAFQRLALR